MGAAASVDFEGDEMSYLRDALARANRWLAEWRHQDTTAESGETEQLRNVEFIGGPFDGQLTRLEPSELYCSSPAIFIPVSRAQCLLFEGTQPHTLDRPTSIAMEKSSIALRSTPWVNSAKLRWFTPR
jgi:hypothetical protein